MGPVSDEKMADRDFYCDFFNFSCPENECNLFFTHLVSFHSNEPNFLIYCASCPRSFTKVNSLQKHYYRKHKTAADDTHGQNHLMIPDENRLERTTSSKSELKTHVAKFLLRAKEQAKLSQTALNVVKDSVKALFNEYCGVIKQALAAKITDSIGQDFEFSKDMDELFDAEIIFGGLNTEHQQRSYYLSNLNLVVCM